MIRLIRSWSLPLLMLSAAPQAWAATWQVNIPDDPASGVGNAAQCTPGNPQTCTLRDALAAAQHGDTVTFDGAQFSTPKTIALHKSLVIARAITVQGPGAALLTIDGQNAVHVLEVNAGTQWATAPVTGPVLVSGLTIANGTTVHDGGLGGVSGGCGGGIANVSHLTLADSVVTGSVAGFCGGGIYVGNQGTLSLRNSTVSNNTTLTGYGGGISASGAVDIDRSTFSGNSVSAASCQNSNCSGGGINAMGAYLKVSNSTFSGNHTGSTQLATGGGAIAAISFSITDITISNSTFSGNSSANDGGAVYTRSPFLIRNSTFFGNTAQAKCGAIYPAVLSSTSQFRVENSTIVGNAVTASGGGGGICVPSGAGVTTPVHIVNSIVSGNSSGGFTGAFDSDIDGTPASSVGNQVGRDLTGFLGLNLAPLGDYGGPTPTMPPAVGMASVARNAAQYIAGGAATDQRGVARPATVGALIDTGAVQVSTSLPSITGISPARGLPGGGYPVTVTGFNLAGGALDFGGVVVNPTGSTANGDGTTSLLVGAPPGTGTVRVSYTVGTDTSPDVPEDGFTYTSQAITFTSTPPASPVVGTTYTVAATGGASGQPVTFAIGAGSTAGSCTVAGSLVSFTGTGTCIVNANQAGDAFYPAASQVQQNMAVGQGSQAIVFTSAPPAQALAGSTYTVAATGGASGLPVVFTIGAGSTAGACAVAGSVVSLTGAGTCTIDANQAGNAHYSAAPRQQQVFAITAPLKTYTGTTVPSTGQGGAASASIGNDGGALCRFDTAATSFVAATPPAGRSAPQGAFRFKLIGCDAGATVRVTTTWPQPVEDLIKSINGGFMAPGNQVVNGNTASFDVTDNQPGDDDPASGVIVDPIMPLAAAAPAGAQAIPTLGEWTLALLAVLLTLVAITGNCRFPDGPRLRRS